jgi:hypothetical protein
MNIAADYNGHELNLSIDGLSTLQAILKRRAWKNIWTLLSKEHKTEIASFSIKTKIPFFNLDYKMAVSFQSENGLSVLNLEYRDKEPHIVFKCNEAGYLIVFHKKGKASLFKDEEQFASIEKNNLTIAGVQKFIVKSDNGISTIFLIVLVCSVIITMYQGPEDSDFTFELGGIFRELRPYNENWKPKILPS